VKRLFDIVAAGPALVLLAPVLASIWVIIRLAMGAPAILRQERAGLHGRYFTILKFRTMTELRTCSGALLPDEDRLTRLGRFLRATSLDELPELWNVLKGDMSLVGPRPLPVRYLARYTAEQFRRHEVTPGVTGWAQVNGRNAMTWPEKFAFDVWYVDNKSFVVDLRILVLTLWKTLQRDGICQPGEATAAEFLGTERARQ
jgi:sugar transferase EpsL